MPVALLLVDALSPVYVAAGALPAVQSHGRAGFAGPLANMYAYRGIEATLFTGRFPDEHGIWGEFRPAPAARPDRLRDRLAGLMIRVGDTLPSDRLRLDVRYVVARLLQPGHLSMGHLIPAGLLRSFQSSTEAPLWEPGSAGPAVTLFDELRAAGLPYEVVVHPLVRHDGEIPSAVAARARRGDLPAFWYIKFSALDALGHEHGPDPERLAPALAALNGQLERTIAALRAAYGEALDIVVVSDHGMSAVERALDVRPALRATGLQPGRDYLYFLDSTTVRIWCDDPGTCAQLAEALAALPGLRPLDPLARARARIPDDESTGDLLFALDEGAVVFPDFFRRQTRPKGMHGYARVASAAGLPYLAVEPSIAGLLPQGDTLTHADLWAAMRARLGLGAPAAREELRCTSLR
ncbi:MAG TPA: alkaline phosphatase family protein [Roseiflexaceae bacterium]|nr:alkaline phosphatase family protein [Roseiflexaceae bacterium]